MPPEAGLPLAALVGSLVTVLALPLAIRVAHRTRFLDYPHGYKAHAVPTPYGGGLAVAAGILLGWVAGGQLLDRYWPLALGIGVFCLVGTVDDRRGVSILIRVVIEVAVAAWLWDRGLGWAVGADEVSLALTIVWV